MPEVAQLKPRQTLHVHVHYDPTMRGDTYYVLHNTETNTYLEIDPQNYFLWELMDGEHTLTDLAMVYAARYGSFPFERLDALIIQLDKNGLIGNAPQITAPDQATGIASSLQQIADRMFQREFDWYHADEFFTRFYRCIGRFLFTRAALIGFFLLSVAGFGCFLVLEPSDTFQLFTFNESYGQGLLVLVIANWVVVFWHESGHALTCKSFGRQIHKAGIMFYYGMPAFFVDVSDMWMEGRIPRIMVSLAGPVVNVIIGATIAILVMVLPHAAWTKVLFQAAYIAYLGALLNMNPLLELDGYYVLMDLLEMPQLRKKSFEFLRTGLPRKIRTRSRFTREEVICSIYSILSLVFTVLIVLVVLTIWEHELRWMVSSLISGQDILAVVLLGGLTILAGASLVLGLAARTILFAGRVRERFRSSGACGGDDRQ
jgi:putative peptide zinc metalloprotease protein